MDNFLSGAVMMGFAVAGLFFLRFYQQTRDRLFAIFALAFWALGLNRFALVITNATDEFRTFFYVVRLIAFVLILVAILDKNRTRHGGHLPAAPQRRRSAVG